MKWKPIPGFEGFYEVSDTGKVKSLAREIVTKSGRVVRIRERILAGCFNSKKYPLVDLWRDRKRTTFTIHRLVMLAFVGPAPLGFEVCHNDGNSTNNHLSNLRYDTRRNNFLDRRKHGSTGFRPVRRGDGVEYASIQQAVEDGFNRTAIVATCRGRHKTHAGFKWEYIE